eukprot:14217913-Alexandrium_andersonii.AAC.1
MPEACPPHRLPKPRRYPAHLPLAPLGNPERRTGAHLRESAKIPHTPTGNFDGDSGGPIKAHARGPGREAQHATPIHSCLLYTSPSPRD